MKELFTGFPDDDTAARNKLNGDYEGAALAGDITPYDFSSHAKASHDGPPGPEGTTSFIWHYLRYETDE